MGRGKTTFVQAVIENRMNAGAVGQWSDIRILERSAVNVDIGKKRDAPQPGRFSIGSAPLTSITETDAQISGGETRQDYKDTRRFPLVAPSCALLFLPFGLPVSFRCYGRVYLIPRLTLSSGKAVRSKLDCMHEPPVQSDCCACSGNYRLESNPERHDKTPLAAATGKQDVREM